MQNRTVDLIILNSDRYAAPIRAVVKQKDLLNPEIRVVAVAEDADEHRIQEALLHGACDLVSIGQKLRLQAVVSRELRAVRVERALNSTLSSASSYRCVEQPSRRLCWSTSGSSEPT